MIIIEPVVAADVPCVVAHVARVLAEYGTDARSLGAAAR